MCKIIENENFDDYNYIREFSTIDELLSLQSVFEGFLSSKHKDDLIQLEIYDNSLGETSCETDDIYFTNIIKLSERLNKDSDDFQLRIHIKKQNFSIYSIDSFLKFVDGLEFNSILNNFNKLVKSPPESLNIIEHNLEFSSTICSNTKSEINRIEYISIMGDSVNAFGLPSHSLLPDDFNFNYQKSYKYESNMDNLFKFIEKLRGLLSLFFLCDSIELEKNNLTIKIVNTYTLRSRFSFSELTFASTEVIDELYKIYEWVYHSTNGEHIQDKLELARIQLAKNISVENNCLNVKSDNIMSNLNSMYKIYLKENVTQYISATNKVAEVVSDMTFKQNEITASFTNSLKTNSTLLIGFFITLVVYNNLAAGEPSIFNNSNFILVVLFTVISAISLSLSFHQVNRNLERANTYFNKQKEIYLHLFHPDDIEQLFSDEYLNSMEISVKKERNLYTRVWIIELAAIFLTSLVATYYPNLVQEIIKLLITSISKQCI